MATYRELVEKCKLLNIIGRSFLKTKEAMQRAIDKHNYQQKASAESGMDLGRKDAMYERDLRAYRRNRQEVHFDLYIDLGGEG